MNVTDTNITVALKCPKTSTHAIRIMLRKYYTWWKADKRQKEIWNKKKKLYSIYDHFCVKWSSKLSQLKPLKQPFTTKWNISNHVGIYKKTAIGNCLLTKRLAMFPIYKKFSLKNKSLVATVEWTSSPTWTSLKTTRTYVGLKISNLKIIE